MQTSMERSTTSILKDSCGSTVPDRPDMTWAYRTNDLSTYLLSRIAPTWPSWLTGRTAPRTYLPIYCPQDLPVGSRESEEEADGPNNTGGEHNGCTQTWVHSIPNLFHTAFHPLSIALDSMEAKFDRLIMKNQRQEMSEGGREGASQYRPLTLRWDTSASFSFCKSVRLSLCWRQPMAKICTLFGLVQIKKRWYLISCAFWFVWW